MCELVSLSIKMRARDPALVSCRAGVMCENCQRSRTWECVSTCASCSRTLDNSNRTCSTWREMRVVSSNPNVERNTLHVVDRIQRTAHTWSEVARGCRSEFTDVEAAVETPLRCFWISSASESEDSCSNTCLIERTRVEPQNLYMHLPKMFYTSSICVVRAHKRKALHTVCLVLPCSFILQYLHAMSECSHPLTLDSAATLSLTHTVVNNLWLPVTED